MVHPAVHKVATRFSRVNAELMEDPKLYSGVRLRVTAVRMNTVLLDHTVRYNMPKESLAPFFKGKRLSHVGGKNSKIRKGSSLSRGSKGEVLGGGGALPTESVGINVRKELCEKIYIYIF